jgi:hypothetical protein
MGIYYSFFQVMIILYWPGLTFGWEKLLFLLDTHTIRESWLNLSDIPRVDYQVYNQECIQELLALILGFNKNYWLSQEVPG